jgi:hypothetical protein
MAPADDEPVVERLVAPVDVPVGQLRDLAADRGADQATGQLEQPPVELGDPVVEGIATLLEVVAEKPVEDVLAETLGAERIDLADVDQVLQRLGTDVSAERAEVAGIVEAVGIIGEAPQPAGRSNSMPPVIL